MNRRDICQNKMNVESVTRGVQNNTRHMSVLKLNKLSDAVSFVAPFKPKPTILQQKYNFVSFLSKKL